MLRPKVRRRRSKSGTCTCTCSSLLRAVAGVCIARGASCTELSHALRGRGLIQGSPDAHTPLHFSPVASHFDFSAWVPGVAFSHDALPPESTVRIIASEGVAPMMVDDRAPDRDARPLSGVYDAKDAQEGLLPQAFYVHDAQGNIQARQYDPVFLAAAHNADLRHSAFVTKVQPQINLGPHDGVSVF